MPRAAEMNAKVVDTQEDVTNYEVTEAIEENFWRALKNVNASQKDEYHSHIYVYKSKVDAIMNEETGKMSSTYRIFVNNHLGALAVVEKWREPRYFDDLAFGNSDRDKKQVIIREIRKIHTT